MKIICPQCDFLKDVPEERFPSSSFMATCPKCRYRFRIAIENTKMGEGDNQLNDESSQSNQNNEMLKDESTSNTSSNTGTANNEVYTEHTLNNQDDRSNPEFSSPNNYQDRHNNNNNYADRQAPSNDEYNRKGENLHKDAYNAYESESRRRVDNEINDSFAIENPWENAQQDGYISSFYQTVLRIMFFAPRFFAGLSGSVSLTKSLMFYILVVVLQVLISSFWANTLFQYIANSVEGNEDVHTLLSYITSSNLPMTLLVKTAFSVMQLYVSTLVYYLAFSIVLKERVDFSLVFQIVAYSIAPLLLSIVPLLGSLVGMIWALACSFIGCRYALRLTIMQTTLALAPIYMLVFPLLYIIISAPV